VRITAQVSLADTPVSLAATVGLPGELLTAGQPASPVPVDITLQAANASLTVKGTVAHPETLSGADLALGATIPDLSKLSPLAHRNLPAVTQIAFQVHLTDAPGGFRQGATLHDIRLTTADGGLSGDIGVASGPPPTLTGKLHADRIDADALMAAAGKPVTNPAPAAGGAPPPATSGGSPPAPPPPPQPRPTGAGRLIPDTPIPFGVLRQANADLAVSVGDLKTGGSDYRSIDLHAVLQDGKLHVAPLSADLPEGRFDANLSVDATVPAPPVALKLHAPGLEVAPLLAAAGLPGYANGKLEIYADLRGAGDSPHAIAAGLDGSLGLAMQNGTIDTRLLQNLLGPMLQKANLLALLSRGGSSDLRCFALRADAQHGVAELRALDLNSSVLTMDGTGSVNLGEETLALQVRPQGRLAGTTIIVVPLRVTGPIRSPDVMVNAIGAAESNAGTVAGAVISNATPLGLLGGMLGGGKLLDSSSGGSCAGPLALARGQAAPAPAAASSAQTLPKPKSSGSGALLHDLFR
jgi:AsmA protein